MEKGTGGEPFPSFLRLTVGSGMKDGYPRGIVKKM